MKYMKLLFLSVILFVPALPVFNICFFAWIAFVPYFISVLLSDKKIKLSFIYGLLLASIIYGFSLFLNGEGIFLRLSTFFFLVLLQGILFGFYGFFIKIIESSTEAIFKKQVLTAAAWLVIEFISVKVLYGAAVYIGLTQHNNFLILPLVKYIGLYGTSFLVMLSNIYLANLFLKHKKESNFSKKDIIVPVILCIFLTTGFLINNYSKEDSHHNIKDMLKVSIVQANISSAEYKLARGYPSKMKNIFSKHMEMSLKAVNDYNPDIVVWPETAVHRWALRLQEYREEIFSFAGDNNIYLITGFPDLNEYDEEYNSVFVISPEGKVAGKYNKNVLVPVWEKAFLSGKTNSPVATEKFSAGINICFEAFFPNIAAEQAEKGADILFILSNNGMLGYTLAPYFSSASSVFRAAENNIYVVQSMNTGISQFVSPAGQILVKSKLFTNEIINYKIPLTEGKITFFTKYGEIFYLLITITFIIYILFKVFEKNKF